MRSPVKSLLVRGGSIRGGYVSVSGNKNAVLPMLAALLLTDEEMILHNVPDILDVRTMLDIAGELGAEFTFEKNTLRFRCTSLKTAEISRELCSRNRTSILFAAPLLARCSPVAAKRCSIRPAAMSSAGGGWMGIFTA